MRRHTAAPLLSLSALELLSSGSTFLERLVAIVLEDELRRPPITRLPDEGQRSIRTAAAVI
jgi:hypothetical protein